MAVLLPKIGKFSDSRSEYPCAEAEEYNRKHVNSNPEIIVFLFLIF